MSIKDMVVGNQYYCRDFTEYDLVECLEINPKETPPDCFGVKVKYVVSGETDIWFEANGAGYSIEVFPYQKNKRC